MSDFKSHTSGYMKPPVARQFKKGRSGNPKGRPKAPETPYTALQKVLDRKVKGGAKWWEVLIHVAPPKTGWVHSRFLKQEPPNSTFEGSEAGFALKCIGTEPFWDLDVDIGSAEMEESGEGRRQLRASPWIMAQGLRDQFSVQLSNKDGSEFGWVAIAGAERRCTDNMSDNVYPLTATVIRREGSVLGGCCYRGGEKSSPVRR